MRTCLCIALLVINAVVAKDAKKDAKDKRSLGALNYGSLGSYGYGHRGYGAYSYGSGSGLYLSGVANGYGSGYGPGYGYLVSNDPGHFALRDVNGYINLGYTLEEVDGHVYIVPFPQYYTGPGGSGSGVPVSITIPGRFRFPGYLEIKAG